MSDSWWFQVLGQECGPLKLADLAVLAQRGTLTPCDLVRRGDSGDWAELRACEEIAQSVCAVGSAKVGATSIDLATLEEMIFQLLSTPIKHFDEQKHIQPLVFEDGMSCSAHAKVNYSARDLPLRPTTQHWRICPWPRSIWRRRFSNQTPVADIGPIADSGSGPTVLEAPHRRSSAARAALEAAAPARVRTVDVLLLLGCICLGAQMFPDAIGTVSRSVGVFDWSWRAWATLQGVVVVGLLIARQVQQ